MTNETLFDKAERQFNVALMIRESMGEDERYLTEVGYHLQQAVEQTIKYLLEMQGVSYAFSHDITYLIRLAEENDADICLTEYIDEHSEMLSSWEANTRYVLNYTLELRKVDAAIENIEAYLDKVSEKIRQELEEENGDKENPNDD